MTDDPNPPSTRAQERKAAKARRDHKAGMRQIYFQALASGFRLEEIAELAGVSARTVRREIERAIDARRFDAPERYAHLQVERLTKALTDAAIERGYVQAVAPHVKIVAALDRYHGLGPRPASSRRKSLAALPPPEPAAPLQLTRAAPPLAEAPAQEPA